MTTGNGVQGYALNPSTGATTPLAQGQVPSGEGFAQFVAADPSGTFLYVSAPSDNAHGNQIGRDQLLGYRIDPSTGTLTAVQGSPITLTPNAGPILVHPSGKFLYMARGAGVAVYAIDSTTGALTAVPGSPFALWPNTDVLGAFAFAMDPAGKFLYVGLDATSGAFHMDLMVAALDGATGKPTPVPGAPFARTSILFPSLMATDAQGQFLFTGALMSAPNLEVDAVATNGTLTQVGNPYATSQQVYGIATDPKAPFVYVYSGLAGVNSGLFAFHQDAGGALTPVAGSPFVPNLGLGGLVVDQAGKFLYGGSNAGPLVFSIDPNTGALTPLPGNATATGTALTNAVVTVAY